MLLKAVWLIQDPSFCYTFRFYEWKRDKDKKQPYFIYFPQDTWVKKEQTEIKQEESDQNFNIKQEPCDQNPKEPMKTEKLEIKQEILDENCSMKEKSHGEGLFKGPLILRLIR